MLDLELGSLQLEMEHDALRRAVADKLRHSTEPGVDDRDQLVIRAL